MSKRTKYTLITTAILIASIIAYLFLTKEKKQKNIQMYAVPKNAAAVVEIDLPKLLDKADPTTLLTHSGFSNNKLFSAAFNAVTSGIDPDEIIYGFAVKEQMDDFLGIVIRLTDADQFASFVKDAGVSATPEDKGDFKFIAAGMNYGIGYTDDVAVLLYSKSDNIAEYAGKYLQLDVESSIDREPDFAEFHLKKFDAGIFTNNAELSGFNEMTSSLSVVGMNKGHGELLCSFENDRVTASYKNIPTADIFSLFSDASNSPGVTMKTRTPSSPLLYAKANVNTDELFNLLQNDSSTAGSLHDAEGMIGTSFTSIKSMFTGELSFAMTDYKELSGYDPRIRKLIDDQVPKGAICTDVVAPIMFVPMTYINIGINDKNGVNKLLSSLGMEKTNAFYQVPGIDLIVYAGCDDSDLMISNDYYAVDSLTKNIGNNALLPSSAQSSAVNEPVFGWLDLDASHYPKEMTDTSGYVYKDNSLGHLFELTSPFRDLTVTVNKEGADLTLMIKPGDGNSLNRLLLYYADLK